MRLIDADALLRYIEECNNIDDWCVSQYSADWISSFIESAPTVDIKTEVVKVVRCKDCEHWEATDDGVSWNNKGRTDGVCERLWSIHCAERHLTERDHYCGYGRRKTQKEGVGE